MENIMSFRQYIELAKRTESTINPLKDSVNELGLNHRMLHAILGVESEWMEFLNAEDYVNGVEELGDILWFIAILTDAINDDNFTNEVDEFYKKLYVGDIDADDFSNFDTDSGEVISAIKATLFYGKKLDLNIIKDYIKQNIQLVEFKLQNDINLDLPKDVKDFELPTICRINIEKLQARYPEKFTVENTLNRNLEKERQILAGKK